MSGGHKCLLLGDRHLQNLPCDPVRPQPDWALALNNLLMGDGTERLVSECLEADRARNCTVRKSNSETHSGACCIWSMSAMTLLKILAAVEREGRLSARGVVRTSSPQKGSLWPWTHPHVPVSSGLSCLRKGFKLLWGGSQILKEALKWGTRIQQPACVCKTLSRPCSLVSFENLREGEEKKSFGYVWNVEIICTSWGVGG